MLLLPALAIIAFAAAFHLHWALGGRLGYSVSLPHRALQFFERDDATTPWQLKGGR